MRAGLTRRGEAVLELSLKKKMLAVCCAACLVAPVAGAAAQVRLELPEKPRLIRARADLKTEGPELIFSDSPEVITAPGVLYRSEAEGPVRVFFHHVNGSADVLRLAVIIRNPSPSQGLEYRALKHAVSASSSDYLYLGKSVQKAYFGTRRKAKAERLEPCGSRELISGSGALVGAGELVTGTLDLVLSAPAEICVMAEATEAGALAYAREPLLPQDSQRLRGTFYASDWDYTLRQPVYAGKIPLALELASPAAGFAKGIDAPSGEPAENYGNYGVIYRVNFEVAGDAPVSFVFNPLGGPFAGYGLLEDKFTGSQKLVPLPEKDTAFGDTVCEATELARLDPGSYSFTWSPPGSSFLPVRLLWLSPKLPVK